MSPKQGVPKPLQPPAPRNLSPKQFVTLYRGLRNAGPKDLDTSKLGSHWSSDIETAHSFAKYGPNSTFLEPRTPDQATIVKARVHPDSIVKPHTEEWYKMGGIRPGSDQEKYYEAGLGMDNNVILPPDSHESESTVRPGSKVKITGMTHLTDMHLEANTNKKKMRMNKKGKA